MSFNPSFLCRAVLVLIHAHNSVFTDELWQVSFKNVCFSYASRPDAKVLDNFSLEVPAGKTVALVGESGCGMVASFG